MYSVPTQDKTTRMSLCALKPLSPNTTTFSAGYVSNYQPQIMGPAIDNVCCGADVSVPSQSTAYYFGGLMSENDTPLIYPYPTRNYTSSLPTVVQRLFVECDQPMGSPTSCSYLSVPSRLAARAEAGLIWVPYGKRGLIILIGGTTQPADLQLNNANTSNSSPSNFLTDVWIYDIDGRIWYNQSTSTTPGHELPAELASFCSVVVDTADKKNQHIYIYGGYDPTAETITASDQVWILTLPSFKWVLANPGNPQHRRQNHKCVLPSPTQMISIGGMIEGGGPVQDSILDLFDLNLLNWTSSYHGDTNAAYKVSESVISAVGGTASGGVEVPAGLDADVAALLSTPYQGEVRSYYPYANCGNETTAAPGGIAESLANRLGLPDWMGAVLAISLSLLISLWAILALIAFRRRAYIRAASVDTSIVKSKSLVVRWMHNAPTAGEKGKQRPTNTVIQRDSFMPLKLAYVDEEEVSESRTAVKSTGSSIGTYERSFLDENGEIELGTFLGADHVRTPSMRR